MITRKTTGIVIAAAIVALAIAKAPVTDIEVNAQLQAEAAAMTAPPPCWDELPFRVALTQENIDRLCIKVQRPRSVRANSIATHKE
jgi:hypothetical protein